MLKDILYAWLSDKGQITTPLRFQVEESCCFSVVWLLFGWAEKNWMRYTGMMKILS